MVRDLTQGLIELGLLPDVAGAPLTLQRLLGGRVDLKNHGLEARDAVLVRHQPRAAAQQVLDLGAVGHQGRALVEQDLVDTELGLEVTQQADERLTDRAGADDENVRLLGEDGLEVLPP